MILILSLWTMSVLTSLTVTQAGTVGMSWRLTEQPRELGTAARLAREAVCQALVQIAADETRSWDAPSEPWGQVREGQTVEGAWSVVVQDENGRLNLNTASPEALARLPESSEASAAAIVAARAQRPLRHLAELALIAGITVEQVTAWEPLVTALGRGAVNVNSAPAGVLEALGLSPSGAARLQAWRDGPDGRLGTNDDHVFSEVSAISPAISSLLVPEDLAAVTRLIATGQFDVRSMAFRVMATSAVGDRPTSRRVTALVERQAPGRPPIIRGWHEDS